PVAGAGGLGLGREPGEVVARLEGGAEVGDGGVPGAERGHAPAVLDGGQDRRRVVGRAVDHGLLVQLRRDHHGRDPGAGTPLVAGAGGGVVGRGYVVPGAAELV